MKRKNLFPVLIILLLVVLFGSYYLFSDNSRYETIDLSPTSDVKEIVVENNIICKNKYKTIQACVGNKYCECSSSVTGRFIVVPQNGLCPEYSGGIVCSLHEILTLNEACIIGEDYARQLIDKCDYGCYEHGINGEKSVIEKTNCCAAHLTRICDVIPKDLDRNPFEIA